MFEIQGKYTTAKVMIDNIDLTAMSQIYEMANHPSCTKPIAIMPDTHAGKGCVIGFTMPIDKSMVPNFIGVDIGCGMVSVNIGKHLPMELDSMDAEMRRVVPMGFNVHRSSNINKHEEEKFNSIVRRAVNRLGIEQITGPLPDTMFSDITLKSLCKRVNAKYDRVKSSVGTLGGGNHFIEVGKDEQEDYWVTIHSGSRNLGKCVCDYHQDVARQLNVKSNVDVEAIKKKFSGKAIEKEINRQSDMVKAKYPKHAEALEGIELGQYLIDMCIAQQYAVLNREKMIDSILKSIYFVDEISHYIESTHNYINFDDMIARKGAISSYKDEYMVIPFNMRDGLIIVKGKSNAEWNYSAPHGAGRILSRSQAKKTIALEDFKASMEGIYSSSVCQSTLDESPFAYKDMDIVKEAMLPSVEIVRTVRPVLNLKSK